FVVAEFAHGLEAGVGVAHVGDAPRGGLAVELDRAAQHAVGRGVLRFDVAQHVLAARLHWDLARDLASARATDCQRNAHGVPLSVQPWRRELELDRALVHSENGSLPRSPRRSRSFISSGSSSNASAMASSSME